MVQITGENSAADARQRAYYNNIVNYYISYKRYYDICRVDDHAGAQYCNTL